MFILSTSGCEWSCTSLSTNCASIFFPSGRGTALFSIRVLLGSCLTAHCHQGPLTLLAADDDLDVYIGTRARHLSHSNRHMEDRSRRISPVAACILHNSIVVSGMFGVEACWLVRMDPWKRFACYYIRVGSRLRLCVFLKKGSTV